MRFDQIQRTLALFAEGIAGHALHLQPDQPGEPSSGKRNPSLQEPGAPALLVPNAVTLFADERHNFGVFRLSVLHQLGYREFGTADFSVAIAARRVAASQGFAWEVANPTNETAYEAQTRPWRGAQLWRNRQPQPALERFFTAATRPALLRRVFALLEDCRIDHALGARYPGVRADLARTFAHALTARPALTSLRPLAALFEALLQWSLGQPHTALLAAIAPAHAASLLQLLDCAKPVAVPGANVYDTVRAALAICALIEARLPALPPRSAVKPKPAMLELPRDNTAQESGNTAFTDAAQYADAMEDIDSVAPPDIPFRGNPGGELPMRLLAALRDFAGGQIGATASADNADGNLTGELDAGELDPPVQAKSATQAQGATLRRPALQGQRSVLYDEWDYLQQSYLKTWCRVHEVRLTGDNHQFISEVRRRHRELAREIKQRFSRIRAESQRRTRGVNDGDVVDWDRLIEARVNRHAGHGSDEALYVRQERAARDVAAVFLLDISASTDFPLAPCARGTPGRPPPDADDADDDPYLWGRVGNAVLPTHAADPPRRVIDAAKESIALMSDALHALGDSHAIYGFSGEGRDQVEFHIAKEFGERSSSRSWGALAAMQPRGATRMGAAIRHAAFKLLQERASKRILLVVSDGYPQDRDYGPDRKNEEYGIQDTARALHEAKRAGVVSFCITIDPAGTDYLRRMCEPARYAVISDIEALPRELARVYRALA